MQLCPVGSRNVSLNLQLVSSVHVPTLPPLVLSFVINSYAASGGVQTWACYLWGLSLYKLLIAVDLTWNWTSRFLKCGNESGNDEFLVHVLWKLNTYLELYLNAEPYFRPWSFVLCWDHSFPKCRYQLWFVRYNQQLCLEGEVPRISDSQKVFQCLL